LRFQWIENGSIRITRNFHAVASKANDTVEEGRFMLRVRRITLLILSATLVMQAAVQAKAATITGCRQPQLQERRALQGSPLDSASRVSNITLQGVDRLVREIRHELLMLPYYDVFDWLEGQVRPDGTVVLRGEVTRPTTKKEAEERVKRIEGVTQVVNEIEVLPPSPMDDKIRVAVYRALFNWDSPLFRYAHRSQPPIHIIVKNGRVWLKGVVATEQDKQLAYMKARSVPGTFDVVNELQVESHDER
jgi:hyperosmotically inducible protein